MEGGGPRAGGESGPSTWALHGRWVFPPDHVEKARDKRRPRRDNFWTNAYRPWQRRLHLNSTYPKDLENKTWGLITENRGGAGAREGGQ